ncbi:MAG TPA: 50S ribosomal protein L23 [Armatimonadetes bacterium]|jgi:large subunit ribosomal protein L23|nr:50S ribosomal protein L23 [Armatimonadota bacterium]
MKNPYTIIQSPVVTERSVSATEDGKYTFRVNPDANKIEIREAIEQIYPNVHVVKVNTVSVRGKSYRLGRVKRGKRPDWKKAIVTLRPGEKIEIFEGV